MYMHAIIVLLMRSKRVLSFNSTTVLNFIWQIIKTFITFLWIYKAVIASISINKYYLFNTIFDVKPNQVVHVVYIFFMNSYYCLEFIY